MAAAAAAAAARSCAGGEGLLTMLTDPVGRRGDRGAPPACVAISNYAVGVDNMDVEAATARGIPVGNTPGVLTESTADLAVALMLALMRRLPEGEDEVRAGEWVTWEPARLLGRDLHRVDGAGGGRRGGSGQAVARRLEGFGATGASRPAAATRWPLAEADVVTLHCPLTAETRGLIGAAELAAMKPDGLPREHRARADRRHRGAARRACATAGSPAPPST